MSLYRLALTILLAAQGCAPTALPPRPQAGAPPHPLVSSTTFEAGGQTQIAYVLQLSGESAMEIVPSSAVRPFERFLPTDDGPWVAINGGFYENDGAMGLVVSRGLAVAPATERGGSGILEAGPWPARLTHRRDWKPGAHEALQSIDRLVAEGRVLLMPRAQAPRAARSIVVLGEQGTSLVVIADARCVEQQEEGVRLRRTSGRGPTLFEAATWVRNHLGAHHALNLDGAISTQAAAMDHGARWSIQGEAGTINAVVLRPLQAQRAPDPHPG